MLNKKDLERLKLQLEAGEIKRYHTHPIIGEQTVGSHTYGVVQLVRILANDLLSVELLCAALDHDVPELLTGDIPFTAKRMSTELKILIDNLEAKVIADYGLSPSLTAVEYNILKQADLLEMGFFAIRQIELGNKNCYEVVENVLAALTDTTPTINGTDLTNILEGM